MPCDKDRKVAVGFKDPKEESEVRRAPRIFSSRSLSEPPSQRSADQAQGARRRNSRLRVKERMRICVHTAASSSHGSAMGGRCKNCQEPTPTGGRQRAPNRRRARHSPRRHRGHNELDAAGSHQPRSKRRRGPNTRAPAVRRVAHRPPSTADSGPGESQLIAAMATCLVSQASVLAAMVPRICLGAANSGQMAPAATEPRGRRPRHRGRGQSAASGVARG
ncbi:PHD and RING finger domain-containing protein 1-like [Drosophila miranda]|uniref:PHD and RING finger domain-containing protein 1-like n=1 Tax=Drosophila miranda TaxID=7229 RepID=UPI00143F188E|nr:PHD and RING finger domain-containing protein 1-like [Drosophila miranda]